MKKTVFLRTTAFMVLIIVVVASFAGCKTESAALNWGTDPTYAPFEYADADNKPTGF